MQRGTANKGSAYMILRKLSGEWVNLYPPHQGELPPSYATRKEAEAHAKRLDTYIGLGEYKIVTKEEALKHEVPKRW